MWRMIGVDPVNLHVDAHLPDLYNAESPAIHTMAPLRGSVTGRAAVYGLSGQRLSEGYCDLSHFGLGNRHRGGFVPLPLVYTDLHQMVRQCICIMMFSFFSNLCYIELFLTSSLSGRLHSPTPSLDNLWTSQHCACSAVRS